MPYIKQEDRKMCAIEGGFHDFSAGELNYLITKLCHQFLQSKGVRYTNINEVIGVLECAKLELYRMIASPYEDKKRIENGGVSDLDAKTLEDVR